MGNSALAYRLDNGVIAKWYRVEPNPEQVIEYIIGLDSAVISSFTN